MNEVFPYANIVTGVLVFIIGFVLHFIGQLISVLNWDFATKIGVQEKGAPPEYRVYEHGIAMSDVLIGWLYGLAAVGLILDITWGYILAWFPGVVFVYHSLGFWFWSANQKKAGHDFPFAKNPARPIWFLANFTTGVLTILVACSRIVIQN